jgi:hypothetical protein
MARAKSRQQREEPKVDEAEAGSSANLVQQRDIGYVPVEERGGAISVSEGDAGPVGAIAVVASAVLRGGDLGEREAELLARAFGTRR